MNDQKLMWNNYIDTTHTIKFKCNMKTIFSDRKFRSKAEKVLWITLAWTGVSVMQFLTTYAATVQFGMDTSHLEPKRIFVSSILTGAIAGLVGGSTMVFFWEKWLRSKPYSWSILNILWSFTLIYILVAVVGSTSFHSTRLNVSFLHPELWQAVWGDMTSLVQVTSYVFWLIVVLLTLIALQVNDKYGPGMFLSFLMGKYFHPKREERIFMFLDLRGSTRIAEKLGESRYFNFLKDIFRDITPGILNARGEIYQYVGDEVVVSWKDPSGVSEANCIQCFLNIQRILSEKAARYQKIYDGEVPQFKAGLHSGYVMVGEIGIVKREIAYSGDVLNTAARIQSKCNELGVDILLSRNLLDKITVLPEEYHTKALGAMQLRGKQQEIGLYTLQTSG
jgi:adenylate cyclase